MEIKVCGMKYPENIEAVVSLKPDYIGFVFHPASPRDISIAAGLAGYVKSISSVQKVGVFVNVSEAEIRTYTRLYKLDMIQLHGDESPDYCRLLQKKIPVIKAFSVNGSFNIAGTEPYRNACCNFLFDSGKGGTGKAFDWQLLFGEKEIAHPFFLSGGISEENLAAAISMKHPQFKGVDINSCFEQSPGYKDIQKIKSAIHEVRNR